MLKLLSLFSAIAGTAGVAYLLTPLSMGIGRRLGAVDYPSPRKIHTQPIPRLGGLAVVASTASCFSAILVSGWPISLSGLEPFAWGLGLGLLPILLVSFIDDLRPVPAPLRLAGHVLGAAIALSWGIGLRSTLHIFGHPFELGVLALPLSLVWLVGVTNAFNLIDGLDGLAAGLALISSGSLAGVFLIAGHPEMAFVSLILTASLLGFLPFNLHPARVFLGDTGATAIGFTVACLALMGVATLSAGLSVMLPVMFVGIPVADTLIAIARRATRRILIDQNAKVFQPDREHIHHRLLALGISHPRAVLALYGIGLVLAGIALLSLLMSALEAGLLLAAVIVASLLGISRLGYEEFAFVRQGTILKIYDYPILKTGFFRVFADFVFAAFSAYAAIGLKYEDWGLDVYRPEWIAITSVLILSTAGVFWALGLYRGSWRLAGLGQFFNASLAVLLSSVVTLFAFEMLAQRFFSAGSKGHLDVTVSLFVICGLVQLCLVNGFRASYRLLKDRQSYGTKEGASALIYGAGYRGAAVARECLANEQLHFRPVGFIDDDRLKAQREVNGIPIMGGLASLADIVKRTGARALVVAAGSIPEDRLLLATQMCEALGVDMLIAELKIERLLERAERSRTP